MPELPEVETVRRQLVPDLLGRTIVDAWAFGSEKFSPAEQAVGATIGHLGRRGKYLLLDLVNQEGGDEELVIHLGMTGQLTVTGDEAARTHPHVRAWWQLDDGGVLVFKDVRRFGRIRVVPAGVHDEIRTLARLGPEPDDPLFTSESLRTALNGSSRRIKTQLLSQEPVAGLGNIYADEALWRAQVRPTARRITKRQSHALHAAIREVLAEAIAHGGTTIRDYRTPAGSEGGNQHRLECYGRGDEPCLRCGEILVSRQIDQRTTTWCRSCQS